MKKHIVIILAILTVFNIIQFVLIINKNIQIETYKNTKQQIKDIFQKTSEFDQLLFKYEQNTKIGTYYYKSIGQIAHILTYMKYNIEYEKSDDPLYLLKLALHNIYGLMTTDQGKELITYYASEIRAFLNEIVTTNSQSRIKDRDKTIKQLNQFLIENLVIDGSTINDKNPINDDARMPVPKLEIPEDARMLVPELGLPLESP